jgi:hypothetical protein
MLLLLLRSAPPPPSISADAIVIVTLVATIAATAAIQPVFKANVEVNEPFNAQAILADGMKATATMQSTLRAEVTL